MLPDTAVIETTLGFVFFLFFKKMQFLDTAEVKTGICQVVPALARCSYTRKQQLPC